MQGENNGQFISSLPRVEGRGGQASGYGWAGGEGRKVPSSIPSPERRIGTRQIFSGDMEVVPYSYPRGVLLCPEEVGVS